MKDLTLARKWRPISFQDISGQEHVIESLSYCLHEEKLHHTYLFSGSHGVGKTTIARIFSKGMSCKSGITDHPCNRCDNCTEIQNGSFIDLIEVDAASKSKIEHIKEILDNSEYLPAKGKFKIFLIDEVHMLSRYSFNALLKKLEEPPEHIKFLLATTNPEKLPSTIISRCLHFQLNILSEEKICDRLERIFLCENVQNDLSSRKLIARLSGGSLRDALNISEQVISVGKGKISKDLIIDIIGIPDEDCSFQIMKSIAQNDFKKMMSIVEEFSKRSGNWDKLLSSLLNFIHEIIIAKFLQNDRAHHKEIHKNIWIMLNLIKSTEDLYFYYHTILSGRKNISFSPTRRIGVEVTLCKAITKFNFSDVSNKSKSST
ncbi:DNA polymerase III subunit gamma/tau [Candidatus Riesia pediculischaeffi]|uniref:DNA polymerase III subunit gamma/tau n=1 Tax=Candidatus Riesia pediculischaeffi PTSU TaxID=1401651 RepID=A0A0C1VIY7_9ENTR|nr:DNA polymerase III subunit gamma/tau [Candidatus Riesia pediculischaeffi]KIE63765.1 DNA polymerase III subunits gamma and tau [Candidatus Riesia pediculischaeffi PTSU]